MNVGCKHTPYNYKSSTASGKVHFFLKRTTQLNFLATGLSNVVTFTTTASKILHDFHQQSVKDDSIKEKMRIIETAAKLIKNDIKSVIQSIDYYPSSTEMSAENAKDFLPVTSYTITDFFLKNPVQKLPHLGKVSCRPQDQEFFYVLYNLDLKGDFIIIFHQDF